MATSDLQNVLTSTIDKAESELYQISYEIWKKPEAEFEEKHAHDLVTEFLTKHGFNVEKNLVLPTGFRAVYGSGSGLNVGVLCEYDALPEIGHGSGRNLVTECSLAVALALKATIDLGVKCNKQLGKVTVIGSPAEESGGGKIDMLSAGVFSDVDITLRAQPHHHNLAKPFTLDMLQVKVVYSGKPPHGALPWEGRNALDAAVLCYNNIAALRQQTKPTMQITGIISNGGLKPSMLPEETEMEFYLRAASARDLHLLQQRVAACIVAAGKASGCEAQFEFIGKPYLSAIHNDTLAELYQKHAEMLGMSFTTDMETVLTPTGSSDMGNLSHKVPSIQPNFSIDNSAVVKTSAFTQAASTEAAHRCTLIVAKALAMAIMEVLEQPELIDTITAELEEANIPRTPTSSRCPSSSSSSNLIVPANGIEPMLS